MPPGRASPFWRCKQHLHHHRGVNAIHYFMTEQQKKKILVLGLQSGRFHIVHAQHP